MNDQETFFYRACVNICVDTSFNFTVNQLEFLNNMVVRFNKKPKMEPSLDQINWIMALIKKCTGFTAADYSDITKRQQFYTEYRILK